jgi:carbon storage regulator
MEKTMLILTRSQNESIVIGDDIKVTVISDRHGQVKLGIDAPDDVEIWRRRFAQSSTHTSKRSNDVESECRLN